MISKRILVFAILLTLIKSLSAQQIWRELSNPGIPSEFNKYNIDISYYKIFHLDINKLKSILITAPKREEIINVKSEVTVQIPMPDGSLFEYTIYNAPVLDPELARNYPGIESFCGKSKQDPTAYLRCEYSPEGFSAMVLSSKFGTVFIDQMTINEQAVYVVYSKDNYQRLKSEPFICEFDKLIKNRDLVKNKTKLSKAELPDCLLRKYRLALACTGEYAAFHGGTKPKVLAAMNKTMTRVSGVYERDLGVTFQIIANNDVLIYLNAVTDPYTNDDGGVMLDENQQEVDTKIGKANYDIGHVFSTGGGGIASLSSVCSNGNKAQGVTGLTSPIGDGFDIDYVAHEMGHQFNGDHSFNNECDGNINESTAYETGSGVSIMGYAGVCDPNVLNHSIDYFHVISLDEITNYITVQTGNTCPVKTLLNNSSPTVNAGLNKTIPKNTPFELKAIGSDPDLDSLTYCWEQFDNESTPQPPTSSAIGGPVFRSFGPVNNSLRIFPMISNIVNNTSGTWEVLPNAARVMNFRVTARDNHDVAGCYATDDVKLTVSGTAGPFLVTYPNTNVTWIVGDTQTITWNVAQTNQTPVSCSKVDIYLSLDGGFTYGALLKSGVTNDGSQEIVVPNIPGVLNRIKVKAANNYFFDISNTNFTIKLPQAPTFTQILEKEADTYCTSKDSVIILKTYFTRLGGFKDSINITVDSLPANTTSTVNFLPGSPSDSANIIIKGLNQLSPGSYTFYVTAASGIISKQASFSFTISTSLPESVHYEFPLPGAKNVSVNPTLQWTPVPFVNSYYIQVSTDPVFGNIIYESQVQTNQVQVTGLGVYKVYYWRVYAENYCGRGEDAPVYSFQTIGSICEETIQPTNVTIPNNAKTVKTSTIAINKDAIIVSMIAKVKAQHSYISDLIIDLSGPDGQSISLFNGSCGSGQNMDATYSDAGQDLICQAIPPAVSGTIKPASGIFNQWANINPKGIWTLRLEDTYPEDGGFLDEWSINICKQDSVFVSPGDAINNTLYLLENTSKTVDSFHLIVNNGVLTHDQIQYVLKSKPKNGNLLRGLNILKAGESFSQQDIDQHLISYMHTKPGTSLDSFTYDILDNNGNWNPNHQFNIVIFKALVLKYDSTNITCYSFNNGEFHLKAYYGIPPYTYSIDNGQNYGTSADFSGLFAGTYEIIVKDSIGNYLKDTINITQPDTLIHILNTTDNNISLLISGGTPPYMTSLDNINYNDSLQYLDLPNGKYVIYIKDANGCENLDSVTINITAAHSFNLNNINIFPSPTKGLIYVKTINLHDLSCRILDNTGKVLRTYNFPESSLVNTLDLSAFSNGLYLVIVDSKEQRFVSKVILQK